MSDQLQLVTQAEAAADIDVSERTIRNWIVWGWVTGYRTGRQAAKVDLDEVRAVCSDHSYGPKARIVTVPGGER